MKRKGIIFDVTDTPRPKWNVKPEAIVYANQRHIEVCQELNGDYTVLTDTDDVLKRGDILTHDEFSGMIRSGMWLNIIPVELVLLTEPHSFVNADGLLTQRRY